MIIFTMKRWAMASAGAIAMMAGSPAMAAEMFTFNFSTVTPLIGGPGAGSGVLTTSGITMDVGGFAAQTITGITGTFNGSAITGLASVFGSNNLYFTTGPTFVNGNGLGFTTAAGTAVNLFFQSSGASSYRINTTGPFTSSFVAATSAAVTAVPEPATWSMMLLGFGGLGWAMRRNRKVTMVAHAA